MIHNEDLHNFCPLQNIALNAAMQRVVSSRHAKCRSPDIYEKVLNEWKLGASNDRFGHFSWNMDSLYSKLENLRNNSALPKREFVTRMMLYSNTTK